MSRDYVVTGTFPGTGSSGTVIVEAASAIDAQAQGAAIGMVVTSVQERQSNDAAEARGQATDHVDVTPAGTDGISRPSSPRPSTVALVGALLGSTILIIALMSWGFSPAKASNPRDEDALRQSTELTAQLGDASRSPASTVRISPGERVPPQWPSVAFGDWMEWGNLRYRLASAEILNTPPALWLQLEVMNPSATRRIDYRTWTGFGIGSGRLGDEHGNSYFSAGGASGPARIDPGQTITEWLAFELPLPVARELTLVPPGSWYPGMKIPVDRIQQ